jgi:hypothetical protein
MHDGRASLDSNQAQVPESSNGGQIASLRMLMVFFAARHGAEVYPTPSSRLFRRYCVATARPSRGLAPLRFPPVR